MLVGTKLQHVVAQLALEVVEPTGPFVGTQLKPRDGLFWFRKPEILLWLIQFISFQVMDMHSVTSFFVLLIYILCCYHFLMVLSFFSECF